MLLVAGHRWRLLEKPPRGHTKALAIQGLRALQLRIARRPPPMDDRALALLTKLGAPLEEILQRLPRVAQIALYQLVHCYSGS